MENNDNLEGSFIYKLVVDWKMCLKIILFIGIFEIYLIFMNELYIYIYVLKLFNSFFFYSIFVRYCWLDNLKVSYF